MKTLQEYLELPYHVSLVRGGNKRGNAWAASIDELPACTAEAGSPEEAVHRVREAMEHWIASALKDNRDIPEPRSDETHSGRLLVRMPKTLHSRLTRAAEQDGVSLNQFITGALAGAVGWRGALPAGARSRNGSGEEATGDPAARGSAAWLRANLLAVALIANFVIVALAGIVALALLIAAWR